MESIILFFDGYTYKFTQEFLEGFESHH